MPPPNPVDDVAPAPRFPPSSETSPSLRGLTPPPLPQPSAGGDALVAPSASDPGGDPTQVTAVGAAGDGDVAVAEEVVGECRRRVRIRGGEQVFNAFIV